MKLKRIVFTDKADRYNNVYVEVNDIKDEYFYSSKILNHLNPESLNVIEDDKQEEMGLDDYYEFMESIKKDSSIIESMIEDIVKSIRQNIRFNKRYEFHFEREED